MPWTYRIPKIRHIDKTTGQPESDEDARRRLAAMPGVMFVEPPTPEQSPRIAGSIHVLADVFDAATAAVLIAHPEALPGAVRLCWTSEFPRDRNRLDAIAAHVNDDLPVLIAGIAPPAPPGHAIIFPFGAKVKPS